MQLVVVESPAKAKTIEKYLGKDYKVLASYGHVRDLPPKDGSVRPEEDFAMDWEVYRDKVSRVKEIADAAKKADRLILATDPDREGEAISWHVMDLLKKRKALPAEVERVTFNAITKDAVTQAMAHPRQLDTDLIDAYLARRALDYLFGFAQPGAVAQAARGQERGPGAVGRAAADRRPRARDRGVQGAGILVGRRQAAARRDRVRRAAGHVRRAEARAAEHRRRGHRRAGQGRGRGRALHGRGRRDQAAQAQSRAAVHHLDAAAGSRAQARLFGEPHDAAGAVALRGGRDHLHAYRRGADGRQRDLRLPPGDRRPVRRALPARAAAHLPDQGQERAGSARGDPPDRLPPHARGFGRRGQALRPDLQAGDGEPDGRREPRADHGHAA